MAIVKSSLPASYPPSHRPKRLIKAQEHSDQKPTARAAAKARAGETENGWKDWAGPTGSAAGGGSGKSAVERGGFDLGRHGGFARRFARVRGDEGTQVWVFCPRGRQTDLPRARSCSASAGTLLADSLSRLSGKGASYPHHSAGVRLGRLAFRTRQKLAKAYVAAPGPGPAGRGRTRSDATCRWSAREPSVEGRARAAGAFQQRHQSSRRRYPAGLASSTQAAGRCRSLRKTASAYATDRGRAGRVRPA